MKAQQVTKAGGMYEPLTEKLARVRSARTLDALGDIARKKIKVRTTNCGLTPSRQAAKKGKA